MKPDFEKCLTAPVGFKGFGLTPETLSVSRQFKHSSGQTFSLTHGSIL
eukprot:CAMPEP_0114020830 /NCGR_PEP_ID=MMETSP0372-20130328/17851_1 /TAXON_ID=340204 /ORGANISM="Lankesteria abbotti" /LENGTH=47 /assembly_acc=CAM_ASM_000359